MDDSLSHSMSQKSKERTNFELSQQAKNDFNVEPGMLEDPNPPAGITFTHVSNTGGMSENRQITSIIGSVSNPNLAQ